MKLNHGSNLAIDVIDLSKSRPGKDFGCGFYLSPTNNRPLKWPRAKLLFLAENPS